MDKNLLLSSLVEVGRLLQQEGYEFTTVTPKTHRRVLEHPWSLDDQNLRHIFRDFFGWNRVMEKELLPSNIFRILEKADLLQTHGTSLAKSKVRYSTLDGKIYAHSPFPTDSEAAVFFGPDSYRFVSFLKRQKIKPNSVLDIGCGSGVGGLSLHAPQCRVILTDINNEALIFAEANAQLNECEKVDVRKSDILKEAPKDVDLLIANPPYMMDRMKRKYRHGGGDYGAEISLNIVKESIEYLKPGASLALYTGSCVVNGEDIFHQHLKQIIPTDLFSFTYEEIDPDVFGEQLTLDQYQDVERIAAIGLVLTRKNM